MSLPPTTNPERFLIAADDLTGAADCASRCFQHGFSASVALKVRIEEITSEVSAFTTDSRWLPPAEAEQRTRELIRKVHSPDAVWYKKMDSTLRGNIGSEIDALIEERNYDLVLVCPAFPLQNRGLRDGFLMLHGVKQEGLHLPSILAAQSHYPCGHVPLRVLEEPQDRLISYLAAEHRRGARILSVDAVTENHLEKVVAAYHNLPYNTLLSGSAGLVSAYAASRKRVAHLSAETSQPQFERVLIVVGSGSQTAERQIRQSTLESSLKLICAGEALEGLDVPTILVRLPPPEPGISLDSAESRHSLERLIHDALEIITVQKPDLLIVTGGDTAMDLLTKLGIERLQIEAEIFPGIPLAAGRGSGGNDYRVILKPGSFGDDHIFPALLKRLQRPSRENRR